MQELPVKKTTNPSATKLPAPSCLALPIVRPELSKTVAGLRWLRFVVHFAHVARERVGGVDVHYPAG